MANPGTSMRRIKELLRLSAAGLSYRQMAGATGLSLGAISKHLKAAEAASLSWPAVDGLTEAEISVRLVGEGVKPGAARSGFIEADYAAIHLELKRKGMTWLLLWEEYQASVGDAAYGNTQFCVRYKTWSQALKRSMRQTHRAGEKLFVDYAGQTVPIIDPLTGKVHAAQIFVAAWGASIAAAFAINWSTCGEKESSRYVAPNPGKTTGVRANPHGSTNPTGFPPT